MNMHIYAQNHWHDEVHIVADTSSLVALRAAIDDAIATGSGQSFAFVGDGEGYAVLIAKRDDAELYDNLAVPYTDATGCGAKENDEAATWPFQLAETRAAWEKHRKVHV